MHDFREPGVRKPGFDEDGALEDGPREPGFDEDEDDPREPYEWRWALHAMHVNREFRSAANRLIFKNRSSVWLFVVATQAEKKRFPLAIRPKTPGCEYLFGQDDTYWTFHGAKSPLRDRLVGSARR